MTSFFVYANLWLTGGKCLQGNILCSRADRWLDMTWRITFFCLPTPQRKLEQPDAPYPLPLSTAYHKRILIMHTLPCFFIDQRKQTGKKQTLQTQSLRTRSPVKPSKKYLPKTKSKGEHISRYLTNKHSCTERPQWRLYCHTRTQSAQENPITPNMPNRFNPPIMFCIIKEDGIRKLLETLGTNQLSLIISLFFSL